MIVMGLAIKLEPCEVCNKLTEIEELIAMQGICEECYFKHFMPEVVEKDE